MKKSIKMAVLTAAAFTFMAGAGISVKAADNVAINEENFAPTVMKYAQEADTNKDGFLSSQEASRVKKCVLTHGSISIRFRVSNISKN